MMEMEREKGEVREEMDEGREVDRERRGKKEVMQKVM